MSNKANSYLEFPDSVIYCTESIMFDIRDVLTIWKKQDLYICVEFKIPNKDTMKCAYSTQAIRDTEFNNLFNGWKVWAT